MTEFVKNYGTLVSSILLLAATIWYTFATHRLATATRKELALRTRAVLGHKPAQYATATWKEVVITQTVVNRGVAYVKLDSVHMEWLVRPDSDKHGARVDQLLPLFVAPGSEVTVSFTLDERALSPFVTTATPSPSHIMDGVIRYVYCGVDDVLCTATQNLPRS